jgi:hypothetical protein
MPQTGSTLLDIESGGRIGIVATSLPFPCEIWSPTRVVNGHCNQLDSQSVTGQPSQAPQEASDYGDSSWSLYSIYCKIVQEDDNNITKCCQKDTDGTLIFVGPHLTFGVIVYISQRT